MYFVCGSKKAINDRGVVIDDVPVAGHAVLRARRGISWSRRWRLHWSPRSAAALLLGSGSRRDRGSDRCLHPGGQLGRRAGATTAVLRARRGLRGRHAGGCTGRHDRQVRAVIIFGGGVPLVRWGVLRQHREQRRRYRGCCHRTVPSAATEDFSSTIRLFRCFCRAPPAPAGHCQASRRSPEIDCSAERRYRRYRRGVHDRLDDITHCGDRYCVAKQCRSGRVWLGSGLLLLELVVAAIEPPLVPAIGRDGSAGARVRRGEDLEDPDGEPRSGELRRQADLICRYDLRRQVLDCDVRLAGTS